MCSTWCRTAACLQVDNLAIHEVLNAHEESRVHLVVDVAEHPVPPRKLLQPGQVCAYSTTVNSPNMSADC